MPEPAINPLLIPVDGLDLVLRLGSALLIGALIGLDRELRDKPAGLRTHMLVGLGSALLALVPIQVGIAQDSADALSRVLQGIIVGVGFIGGGVILHNSRKDPGTRVEGLTSAAAVWVSSSLGIVAGCGLWQLGLVGAMFSLLTLTVVKRVEKVSLR